MWFLVDGIYPELARFVKTVSEPTSPQSRTYAKWQESSRKSIERAFGVFQRKFQIAVRKIEQWYVEDIKKIIESCVILHNMMVEERMDRGEEENSGWYEYREEDAQGQDSLDPAMEYVQRQEAEMRLHRQLQEAFYTGPAINVSDQNYQQQRQLFNLREMAINRRWDMLHDGREHFRLRNSIMQEVHNKSLSNNNNEESAR